MSMKRSEENMYNLYYDSGTTNTRAYLFDGSRLLNSLSSPVGSKDSALAGNNLCLLKSLRQMMLDLADSCQISAEDIGSIWMSGMVSSPTGITELPHLPVPVGLGTLKGSIAIYYEPLVFRRELCIIPGVKTLPAEGTVNIDNFYFVNTMRGEETEIFGILDEYPVLNENSVLIMPGSHTQIAFIKGGRIVNILSTMTGELYQAVTSSTILSTSLPEHTSPGVVIPEMVCRGYSLLNRLGFNRALYTVRTMELFLPATVDERHSFFEGILNGGVVKAVTDALDNTESPILAIYGNSQSIDVFHALFEKYYPDLPFMPIHKTDIPYSARGFLCISGQENA